jgi:hypothetical protein
VLFDHNVDRRLRRHLAGLGVTTTREQGWEQLANGTLLREAAGAGFDVFLTIDKQLRHQQNLSLLPLPVVVLDSVSNALPALVPFAPWVMDLLKHPLTKSVYVIASNGRVDQFGPPQVP